MVMKLIRIGTVSMILMTGCFGIAFAKGEPEIKITNVEEKSVQGKIISCLPVNEPKSIGVAGKDADIFFKLDEDLSFIRKKGFEEIKLGDVISVTYEERTGVTEDGRLHVERIAKRITFIGPAKSNVLSQRYEKHREPREEVLVGLEEIR